MSTYQTYRRDSKTLHRVLDLLQRAEHCARTGDTFKNYTTYRGARIVVETRNGETPTIYTRPDD